MHQQNLRTLVLVTAFLPLLFLSHHNGNYFQQLLIFGLFHHSLLAFQHHLFHQFIIQKSLYLMYLLLIFPGRTYTNRVIDEHIQIEQIEMKLIWNVLKYF